MKIKITSKDAVGGIVAIVTGVLTCPVEIEGTVVGLDTDNPTFGLHTISAILDNHGYVVLLPLGWANGKLLDSGFYRAIVDEIKVYTP